MASGVAAAQPIAFTGATVIDVEEGVTKPGMAVIVTRNRITAIGSEDEMTSPMGRPSSTIRANTSSPGFGICTPTMSMTYLRERHGIFTLRIRKIPNNVRSTCRSISPRSNAPTVGDGRHPLEKLIHAAIEQKHYRPSTNEEIKL